MYFLLNGKKVKCPSKMDIVVGDIDADSTRNAKGFLVRNKLRHIHQLQLSWNEISPSQCAEITSQLNNSEFICDFFCALCDQEHHLRMYAGDRQVSVYSDKLQIYTDFSTDFIEV